MFSISLLCFKLFYSFTQLYFSVLMFLYNPKCFFFSARRQTFQSSKNKQNFSTVWTTSAWDNTSPPVSCVAGSGAVGVLCHWPLTAWVSRAARAPTLIPLCALLRTAALVTELQERRIHVLFLSVPHVSMDGNKDVDLCLIDSIDLTYSRVSSNDLLGSF